MTGDVGAAQLEKRIQDEYENLTPNERRLADLILDFPHQVATYSATEMTERAGVSKSAGTRFFQRLGFESYNEVRRLVRAAPDWGSPLYLADRLERSGSTTAGLEGHLQREITNLTRTVEALAPDRLAEIGKAIASAGTVAVCGWRNSYFMGAYLHWQIIQLRDRVNLLNRSGETAAEHLAGLDAGDLLIVIGVRRRPKALATLLDAASATGVPVLLVTDRSGVTLKDKTTWMLQCEIRSITLFDSYIGVLSVLHVLATATADALGKGGRRRLRKIEAMHDRLEDF